MKPLNVHGLSASKNATPLVSWVPVALGIANNRMPAYLNGMVAMGIVIGAGLAAKFVSLKKVDRTLPAAVLIGACLCVLALTSSLPMAFVVMGLPGACGGFFVVPLNALLQERGSQSVGAGHALAVQNLAENTLMLLMIGLYTLALWLRLSVVVIATGFGVALAVAITALWVQRVRAHGAMAGTPA